MNLKIRQVPEKKVIIVTGGGGFIGRSIVNGLSGKYLMVSLDRGLMAQVAAETVYMDITSDESITMALNRVRYGYGNKIACVVHLAAYYDFSGEPSPLYDKITVQGTKKLLRALQQFEVGQFIFSSSLLVYAPSVPGQKINEEWPLKPEWDYPQSKVKAENIIHAERNNIPVVILRIAGVYSGSCKSIPIANQIQRIYENKITGHLFSGDTSHGNPFVHIDDLVDAIIKTIEKRFDLEPDVIINIGEDETLSYEYMQKTIGRLIHDEDWKTYRVPRFIAKTGAWFQGLLGDSFIKPWMIDLADAHMELNIAKAKKTIGWIPQHTLRETLPEMIAALKANPKKWYIENRLKLPSKLKATN